MSTLVDFLKEQKPDLSLTSILLKDKEFPNTTSIKVMAEYLYLKLDQSNTQQFQQLLMLWFSLDQDVSKANPNVLNELNFIISTD